jgi:hypothetical protein
MTPVVTESPRKFAVQNRSPRTSTDTGSNPTRSRSRNRASRGRIVSFVSQISIESSGVLQTTRSFLVPTVASAMGETCGLSTFM